MIDTNLIDRLKSLQAKVEAMRGYLNIDLLRSEIDEFDRKMAEPDFWNDQNTARKIINERKKRKTRVDVYEGLSRRIEDAVGLAEMAAEEDDAASFADVESDYASIEKATSDFELTTLLTDEYAFNNAIFTIHAGAGGTESQDWVEMLTRMYLRWAELKGFKTQVLDHTPGEEAGTKSIVILFEGDNAYGYLRTERGIHRLVRISPFDANKRRHTSFAAVDVIPEIEDNSETEIDPEEIKVDTYRASGAGGQHVNKTSSAVRLTHIPTGIVVQCQNERSQHKNKAMALKILNARLFERRRTEQEQKVSQIKGEQKDIAWGSQIRSYVFQPYTMVKDLRTRVEVGNIAAVMNGEIDVFIMACLQKEAADRSGKPYIPPESTSEHDDDE